MAYGAVRLLRSMLDGFAGEVAQHARGARCRPDRRPGIFSVPGVAA